MICRLCKLLNSLPKTCRILENKTSEYCTCRSKLVNIFHQTCSILFNKIIKYLIPKLQYFMKKTVEHVTLKLMNIIQNCQITLPKL